MSVYDYPDRDLDLFLASARGAPSLRTFLGRVIAAAPGTDVLELAVDMLSDLGAIDTGTLQSARQADAMQGIEDGLHLQVSVVSSGGDLEILCGSSQSWQS